MPFTRVLAILVFFCGAGALGVTAYRVASSGEIIGTYALRVTSDKRSSTELLSFPSPSERVHLSLIASNRGRMRDHNQLQDTEYRVVDELGRVVFERRIEGPTSGWKHASKGLDTFHTFRIGAFAPEPTARYRVESNVTPDDFLASKTTLAIEARRGVAPPDNRIFALSAGIFVAGVALLAVTRRA